MDRFSDFIINDCGSYYTIENAKARDFENYHTHLNKKNKVKNGKRSTCDLLIYLVCQKRVPDSPYLRESAKRISRDEKYIQKIEHKEMKDANKQKFFKVNNGIF